MSHPFSSETLFEIIARRKPYFSAPDQKGHTNKQLVDHLYETRSIDPETVALSVAEYFGLPYRPPETLSLGAGLEGMLGQVLRAGLLALPLEEEDSGALIAVDDPFDINLQLQLERLCGTTVRLAICSKPALESALKEYTSAARSLEDVSKQFVSESGNAANQENLELSENSAPVVRLTNTILAAAIERRASDIHIEYQRSGTLVRYRIDGVLLPAMEQLDVNYHKPLVTRLKVMSELDITERHTPQDGRFRTVIEGQSIDFRVSVLPGSEQEDVVLRVLDKRSINRSGNPLCLGDLGLDPTIETQIKRAIAEPFGMVLVTGPTGSGKTTTLYAALSELDRGTEKIITIEDPIEYRLEGIVQVPVNEKKKLTFARGLRAILRHDPDKMMIGEIRDPETAEIAVQSALTGHLVLTTIHANSALDVVNRIRHMGIDPYLFVSAVNGVIAQRLIRKLCESCREITSVTNKALVELGIDSKKYTGAEWYRSVGCDHCDHTGYKGRTAIAEYLRMTPIVRQALVEKKPIETVLESAVAEGLVPLREAAVAKAASGVTSLEEVNRVTLVP